MLKSSTSRAVVIGGACFLVILPFFWRGIPSGHDFEFHLFSWMEVLGQWKVGIAYPRWAALAHWGYGEARFIFYPPASWTLGAALGALLPWTIVPAAYCWIVLTLAGAAMYRLARGWLSIPDALFAAVFYALNPYHLLIVYWRSAYAELLAACILPLLLLGLLGLRRPGFRPALRLSLILAAAWLTNAPAAVMIHYSAVGLAAIMAAHMAWNGRSARRPSISPQSLDQVWRFLVRLGLAMLLGVGLASFYLIPTIYEQKWINLNEVMAPGVRPQDNFLFTTIADPDHNHFNLLVSSVALAEIGVLFVAIWFGRKWQSKDLSTNSRSLSSGTISSGANADLNAIAESGKHLWMLLSSWGVACTIVMFSVSNSLWLHFPKFRFVQLPFRWLLCTNAALAVLLTMAIRRWTWRLLTCAFLLVVLAVAGYRLQTPWWDNAADIREMTNAVADGTGYEGTDEYVPAGADPYELTKDLPRISDQSGAAVQSSILTWAPTEKHFVIHSADPTDLTVRLFNYPAWKVTVNGDAADTRSTDVTGLIIIPVPAGDNDVHMYFQRTIDRLAGAIVSLVSLVLLVVVWITLASSEKRRRLQSTKLVSPIA